MVQMLQRDAWAAYRQAGLVSADMEAPSIGFWAQLSAKPGTLGSDYLRWARLYREMGDRKATIKTALNGLRVAPMSLALFEVCLPVRLWPTYWLSLLKGGIRHLASANLLRGKD